MNIAITTPITTKPKHHHHQQQQQQQTTSSVPVIVIIRSILICAIVFEIVHLYHAIQVQQQQQQQQQLSKARIIRSSSIDDASTATAIDVLNTHLALHNIDVEELSSMNSNRYFSTTNNHNNKKNINNNKSYIRNRLSNPFRKKVTYTSKGAIVEETSTTSGTTGSTTKNISPTSKIVQKLLQQQQQQQAEQELSRQKQRNIIEMSQLHNEPVHSNTNITVAICFKTLFGGTNIDLGSVLQWVAYNRLLGVDHIFMWYRKEMIDNPRFKELQQLSYVTLTKNNKGTRKNYYNQWWTEEECNRNDQFAGTYDYVMHADIDEYLWFVKKQGIKEFILSQKAQQPQLPLNYLSFPKRMYTLDHSVNIAPTQTINHIIDMNQSHTFALSNYPFYMNHTFCYSPNEKKRGQSYCPTWKGRAKVIVKPSMYIKIDTHGNIAKPNRTKGELHFNSDEAHFMEWPYIFAPHNVTKRIPTNFTIQTEEEVHIHNLERSFHPIPDIQPATYDMQYDASLLDWFDYVLSRYTPTNIDTDKSVS